MGQPRGPFSNRSQQKTNVSAAEAYSPPIGWVQMVTAGNLVMAGEDGVAVSYTSLPAGAVIPGPFSAFTSTTATQILLGDGSPPPPLPVSSVLGSTTAGNGADAIGYPDAGGFTAQTTTGAAVNELYQHLFSAVGGYETIPLSAWREVDATGDVGDIAANGGVLASDTTPTYTAVATSNEHAITWATGNTDPIGLSIGLPRDFDDTADATLDLEVSSGSTDAATIVCASAWSAGAAGTEVSDSTSDAATKSATPHRISITIAAADIPAGARRVTFRLTPPAHATNAIALHATGLAYKRKLLTA